MKPLMSFLVVFLLGFSSARADKQKTFVLHDTKCAPTKVHEEPKTYLLNLLLTVKESGRPIRRSSESEYCLYELNMDSEDKIPVQTKCEGKNALKMRASKTGFPSIFVLDEGFAPNHHGIFYVHSASDGSGKQTTLIDLKGSRRGGKNIDTEGPLTDYHCDRTRGAPIDIRTVPLD